MYKDFFKLKITIFDIWMTLSDVKNNRNILDAFPCDFSMKIEFDIFSGHWRRYLTCFFANSVFIVAKKLSSITFKFSLFKDLVSAFPPLNIILISAQWLSSVIDSLYSFEHTTRYTDMISTVSLNLASNYV